MKNKIIVVYSTQNDDDTNLVFNKHINSTIGVSHEIVFYKNNNEFSLASLYNKALKEHDCTDAIFCFVHNDLIFKTKNWGRLLLTKFNNNDFGILGVAGSTFLSESGIWWDNRKTMYGIVEHCDENNTWVSEFSKPINNIKEVVLIDGLFIAVDPYKIVNGFDESFDGFHYYDLSFCLPNYLDGCNIGVITTIRILHKSVGQTNPEWDKNRLAFTKQYKDYLPLSIPPKYEEISTIINNEPKVTVIIPTKNNFEILRKNIESWKYIVKYKNYNIIIADTGSDVDVIEKYSQFTADLVDDIPSKISLVKYDYYNFAKINNDVVKNHVTADTELLLFCNDDIELLNDAIMRCVELYTENKTVGTIGIRLHYTDASVQHCGININKDKLDNFNLGHIDLGLFENYKTNVNYNSLGSTGAFLMINKNLFNEIGGFNENYVECFEDVELNLKCLLLNRNNITACDAVAYHYESISRNKDENKMKKLRNDYNELLFPLILKNQEKLNGYIFKI